MCDNPFLYYFFRFGVQSMMMLPGCFMTVKFPFVEDRAFPKSCCAIFDAHLGAADLFRRSRLFLGIFRQKVTDVDVFTIFDFDGYRHGPAVLEDDLVAAIVEDADRVALRIGVAPFVSQSAWVSPMVGRLATGVSLVSVWLFVSWPCLVSPGCCCWVWVCCFCGCELVGDAGVHPAATRVKSRRTRVR